MLKYTIFLGDVALDEYYRTDAWPVIGDKANAEQLESKHGGMIANAACVYTALGGNARFMTPLNRGKVSEILIEGLRNSGISPDYVVWDDSLADSKCIIFLTGNNNTVMVVNTGLKEIRISEAYFEALKGAEYLYSTVSDMLRLRYGDLEGLEIVSKLRQSGVKVLCDFDTGMMDEDSGPLYRQLDIIIFNHIGFDRFKAGRNDEEAIAGLFSDGVSLAIVTYGSDGCRVYTPSEIFSVPAFKVDAVDVTGAGDTFSASLLYALQRMELRKAVRFASAAAAICVQQVGARSGAVSMDQVLVFLDENDGTNSTVSV
jgi:sugar/nucleoside kinase (ribokinase family)